MSAKLKKRGVALAVVFLSLTMYAGSCVRSDKIGYSSGEPQVTPTDQAQAASVQSQAGLGFEGVMVPRQMVQLAFGSVGTLSEIMVSEGKEVKAGEKLARLDTKSLELLSQQAQTLLRAKQLELQKTQAQNYSARVVAAQAEVTQAKSLLAQGRVQSSAPDVTIAEVHVARAQDTLKRAQDEYNKSLDRSWDPPELRDAYARALQQAEWDYQQAQAELERSENMQLAYTARLGELVARVNQADAQLDQTVVDQDPYTITLNILSAEVENARYNFDLARLTLDQATLVAPFDGSVAEILAESGEYVPAGKPVVVLANLSDLIVEAEFDEWSIASLKVGQSVSVRVLPLDNLILSGKIISISQKPVFKPSGETVYKVHIVLDTKADRLKWGMKVEVEPLP